jgi:tetratricopeptide (TPR) repeat protein
LTAFALLAAACAAQAIPSDIAAQERFYEKRVRESPSADLWQRLGLTRHLQNRYRDAIPAFREAVRLDPNLWTAHLFLGIGLYRTNDFASALASMETADRLAPQDHAGRDEIDYWLGAARIALKQHLRGLQDLERLLARNPKHLEALELVTQTYIDLGTNLWNEVAEETFETAPGYEIHGHALEDGQNRQGALEAYATSRSLDPARAGPRLGIARVLLEEAKPAEALELLQEEMELSVDPRVLLLAGKAAAQAGDRSRAERWLKAASEWPATKGEASAALAALGARH